FPTQMTVNYAKNATERHAEILRVLGRGGVHSEAVLSIQSTSEQTLKTIRRQNIKTERYDELAGIFRSEDLTFASDLMIGLPGETVESFKASLQHFFDRDVYVQAYQTILLPNSPMADPEYIRANKIELVGNVLVGSYSYNIEDLSMMVRTARYYALMVNLSIMKYLLYHLQNDRGLRAVDVLARMVQKFEYGDGHTRYPLISWLLNRYRSDRSNLAVDLLVPVLDAPSSWDEFFLEVRDFVVEEFGVAGDAALETALAVQAAVMPREGEQYPLSVELKHDFVRYLEDHRAVPAGTPRPPLSSYPPGRLVVTDPAELSKSERPEPAERDHVTRFELQSGLPSWTVRFPAAARPAGAPAAASAPAAG
ncbi:MAG TPA: hypothetical protein VFB81_20530, partial [Myxococcales bacterium]|nr:hypothetical protein [Myxococcales bacterium]